MNWKLIFGLSLFGLAMAIATVFVIPSKIEPFFWLAIFIICAIVIAKGDHRCTIDPNGGCVGGFSNTDGRSILDQIG